MIILKYSKSGDAKYIPHVDTLRVLLRTLRRMKIKVEYSAGFNPHMLINMSPPLPVGIESETEFLEIQTAAEAEGFSELFGKNCPKGFSALKIWQTEKSPKITANTTAAQYSAETSAFDGIALSSEEPKLYALSAQKGKLIFTIACGNNNLRPDRFLESLAQKYNIALNTREIKITRTKLFTGTRENLIQIDNTII